VHLLCIFFALTNNDCGLMMLALLERAIIDDIEQQLKEPVEKA
jgi:hypothetical protein